ncbi:MAG: cytochrome-c peroxidase [Boseongicola sp.]
MKRFMHLAGILSFGAMAFPVLAQDLPRPMNDADFPALSDSEVSLGQLLFYDPILSGNRNIACATCHHPKFATSDGLSLGLGEGGVGLGPARKATTENTPEQLIPRNSPALFNTGALGFTALFADGRIEVDPNRPSGIRTPLGDDMVAGFDSLLSAQTMFPVLSQDEMAGHYQENDVSLAVRRGLMTGEGGAWSIIADRVASIEAYQAQFEDTYAEIAAGRDVAFTDISNSISAFVAFEWRSDNSQFDAVLRGEDQFEGTAARGAELFYGEGGCADCHSGPLLSDMDFHAMGQPQLGPGKAARFEQHQRDTGRMRVTGRSEDLYAFKTPSLRNVSRTGPWGHAGAFTSLDAFLRQHTSPVTGLSAYERVAILPAFSGAKPIWWAMDSAEERQAIADAAADATAISDKDISAISAFLATMSDETALSGRLGIPDAVPSGLPVDR